jgi:dTDP-4-amino-4,6-dideoxygalactose transaminase
MPPRSGNRTESPDIPFHRPFLTGRESLYVTQAIASKRLAADGDFTRRCASLLCQRLGIAKVLMTSSCTSALEMAALLCRIGPGDEVIMPSFTFVSTANAVVRLGARPVFVDIRPDTLNIDESRIAEAITPRTRAIIPVHYAGVGCAMDAILAIAEEHGLRVIEDAAQAVNAFIDGKALGSLGHLGAFSFHETKNFTCGEGGALCVNDPSLIERAEIIREKGTNRSRFLRGLVDKYTWVDVGSSYLPSEIACAFLLGQLEEMDAITARRRELTRLYDRLLEPLARRGLLRLPCIPPGCSSNYHNYFVLLESERVRDALIAFLRGLGISTAFHFVPLHTSPMGRSFGQGRGDLPITEGLSRRLLRLPFFPDMSEEQQAIVSEQLARFLLHGRPARRPAVAASALPVGEDSFHESDAGASLVHRRPRPLRGRPRLSQ